MADLSLAAVKYCVKVYIDFNCVLLYKYVVDFGETCSGSTRSSEVTRCIHWFSISPREHVTV